MVLAAVLGVIGVPAAGIGLIVAVERILDMCRTTLNVTGDLTACVILDRGVEKKERRREGERVRG